MLTLAYLDPTLFECLIFQDVDDPAGAIILISGVRKRTPAAELVEYAMWHIVFYAAG